LSRPILGDGGSQSDCRQCHGSYRTNNGSVQTKLHVRSPQTRVVLTWCKRGQASPGKSSRIYFSWPLTPFTSPPEEPAKTWRPSGSFTARALHVFEPSLASDPSMVTVSPCFSASRVQPLRVRAFGGPPSHCQRCVAPASSFTSI